MTKQISASVHRRGWRKQMVMIGLALGVACTGTGEVDELPFVTAPFSHRPPSATVQMRAREPRKNRQLSGSGEGTASDGSQADFSVKTAKLLTSNITQAFSAPELLGILDRAVGVPFFNEFHASAAYSKLAKWIKHGRLGPSEKASPVLPRLAARVQEIVEKGQAKPRAVANIFWSLGQLFDWLGAPKPLLMALVKSMSQTARGMKPQELSNVLLACAQLKDVAAEVLTAVPEIAPHFAVKAEGMKPQELYNSLWACAQLKADARHEDLTMIASALAIEIPGKASGMSEQGLSISLWAAAQLQNVALAGIKEFDLVPAIVAEIPAKAKTMIPQAISNCLWAAAQLQDSVPGVLKVVPSVSAQVPDKARNMKPLELSSTVWAVGRLKDKAPEVLSTVPALLQEISHKQVKFSAQHFSNCLEALIPLQDLVPEVGPFLSSSPDGFLGFTASYFNLLLPKLKGNDLKLAMPTVLWACARLGLHQKFLASVAQRMASGEELHQLTDWGLCVLLWSHDVLDPHEKFSHYKCALKSEILDRGLSESDVWKSQQGFLEWKRTKG